MTDITAADIAPRPEDTVTPTVVEKPAEPVVEAPKEPVVQAPAKPDPEAARRQFHERSFKRQLAEKDAEIERLKAAQAAPKVEEPKEIVKPTRPKAADFKYGRLDPDYDAALDKFEADMDDYREAVSSKKESEAAAKRESDAVVEADARAWKQKGEDFEKKFLTDHAKDAEAVQDAFMAMPPHPDAMRTMLGLDNAVDVFHHLGTNPGELERITALGPMAQALEIGKLSAALAKPTTPPPPIELPTTKSTTTPLPLRGSNGKFTSTDDSEYESLLKKTR